MPPQARRPGPAERAPPALHASWWSPHGFVNACLLVALALQYGTQPSLNSRFLSAQGVDGRVVVLFTELLKGALCAASALRSWHLQRSSLARSLARAALPAACYLAQNLCLQAAYRDLDSLTFNCLNQTKVVATALTLYLLTRRGQSPQQCLALLLVVCAGVLLQLKGESSRKESGGVESVAAFRRGVATCLFASALSGLASTLSQLILQGKSSAELTLEMALVTVPVLAVNLVSSAGGIGEAVARARVGWTPLSFLPVLSQALGGIAVGLITKRMGGISKGFAVVGGLTVTGLLQSLQEGRVLSAELWLAWALVVASTWLHGRYPWRRKGD